jgi:site-specific DNA-methyltransferase (cytosine-N4-specific)
VTPYWSDGICTLLAGDALEVLRGMPAAAADCCVTSPPYYGLRDYGTEGQIGLEDSPAAYVERLREVFAEVRRVLADDGTLWLNIGDSYAVRWGSVRGRGRKGLGDDDIDRSRTGPISHEVREKNLMGIPWRTAFALQDDGWVWRNVIVWHKPNATPESAKDRMSTKWEPMLLFSKSRRYHFNLSAISEPPVAPGRSHGPNALRGRNLSHPRSATGAYVPADECNPGDCWEILPDPFDEWWTVAVAPYPEAHFATFPVRLPMRCISTTRPGATVLDPFSGSGTTGEACRRLGRKYTGIDLNPAYHDLAIRRYAQGVIDFTEAAI